MGARDETGIPTVTDRAHPPGRDEFELTLLGPGYGESVVMHSGEGAWVLVDSCGRADAPAALDYLKSIGIDPAEAVKLVVASHWHDDHMRGMAHMAKVCGTATFCCASVLCAKEFLAVVHALEHRHFAAFGSGVREIYGVFSTTPIEGIDAESGDRQPPPLQQWYVSHLVSLTTRRRLSRFPASHGSLAAEGGPRRNADWKSLAERCLRCCGLRSATSPCCSAPISSGAAG